VRLTGITDDQLLGRKLDDQAVTTLATPANLIIAHNAAFDRCFLEASRHAGSLVVAVAHRQSTEGSQPSQREDVYCEISTSRGGQQWCATMVRDDRYKIVVHHGFELGELYDLTADPNETCNRWLDPTYASIRTELLLHTCDRIAETADPLPPRRALVRPAPAVRLIAPMQRKFNVILAWSVDRLGRSLQVMAAFLS
jgi:hypothetical protein